jgi:hypothetical protein
VCKEQEIRTVCRVKVKHRELSSKKNTVQLSVLVSYVIFRRHRPLYSADFAENSASVHSSRAGIL